MKPSAAVDQRNCQRSLENAVNHFAIRSELGVSPENTPEQNLELLRRVWSDRPEGAELRAAVRRAMRARSLEFSELNVEYGYSYNSAAVVPDGTPARRCSWTTSASTSRQPVRARRCRTGGSMTRTATAGPSRTSSSPGGSCSSPARLVVVGAAPALTRVS